MSTTVGSTTNSNLITLAQASSSTKAASTTSTASSGFTADDFMTLLVDQLKNQDPSSPMSESDMANQMAQMETVLELQKMATAVTTLNTTNQKLSATSMIGKTIAYTDSTSQATAQGKVDSVEFSDTDVLLNIGTTQVSLSDVLGVANGS
jgi:flagellar basal-body rod modification protein FlgD